MFVSIWRSAAVALVTLLVPAPAMAYIDPGSGSMILQGIIAAVAGGLVGFKLFWHRARTTLSRWRQSDSTESETETFDE